MTIQVIVNKLDKTNKRHRYELLLWCFETHCTMSNIATFVHIEKYKTVSYIKRCYNFPKLEQTSHSRASYIYLEHTSVSVGQNHIQGMILKIVFWSSKGSKNISKFQYKEKLKTISKTNNQNVLIESLIDSLFIIWQISNELKLKDV